MSKIKPIENHFFVCSCFSDEHTLHCTYDPEDNDMWVSVLLNKRSWHKRLWYGIKYIFGYQSMYGAFDYYTFDPADADRMIEVMRLLKRKPDLVKLDPQPVVV